MNAPRSGGSSRARLRPHRVAHLADQQRLRTGIWFDRAGRVCQHCPACAAVIQIPDPPEFSDDTDIAAYARTVEHRLDQAVFEHLLLDMCPTPERAT
jgi:hypothetical protein